MSLLRRLTTRSGGVSSLVGQVRLLSSSEMEPKFLDYSKRVNQLKEDPGNATKLQLYALFKQATVGANNSKKPGMLDFVAKAKWDAWNSLGDLSKDQAMSKYIGIVQELLDKESAAPKTEKVGKYNCILAETKDHARIITLNRPEKFNALTIEMYGEIADALREADKDDNVTIAVIKAAGPYFCAGNDLGGFQKMAAEFGGDMKKAAEKGGVVLEDFVRSFIEFSKPLIGLINGPAIGISVTVLGLYDVVYASERATFHTPFPSLGQSPEGCSSYTFPAMMGTAKAAEVLLFEKKLSAEEALHRNLISEIIPSDKFEEETSKRIEKYASLPPLSLKYSKGLTRQAHKNALLAVNKAECVRLVERWTSDECINAITQFLTRKQSKL